jgi:hypothetical protein
MYGREWNDTNVIFYFAGRQADRMPWDSCRASNPLRFISAVAGWAGAITDALSGSAMQLAWVCVHRRLP